VILRPGENVCDVLVEENDARVEVLILVCGVYLSAALGDRRIVDAARDGVKVEPFKPNW
jgi:hypothetical protein